jgi:hypothetical protein
MSMMSSTSDVDVLLLRVEQMDKNRIEKIYIKKPEAPVSDAEEHT